jgi:hypothetical protein
MCPLLNKAKLDALDRGFRPGFKYSKAELPLMNRKRPPDTLLLIRPSPASSAIG